MVFEDLITGGHALPPIFQLQVTGCYIYQRRIPCVGRFLGKKRGGAVIGHGKEAVHCLVPANSPAQVDRPRGCAGLEEGVSNILDALGEENLFFK